MNLIELNISGKGEGALLTYGAWTDRQRARFMAHFYPANYQNLSYYNPKPGAPREAQFLEVHIFFYHQATLRVPYRQQNIYNLYDIKTFEMKQRERQLHKSRSHQSNFSSSLNRAVSVDSNNIHDSIDVDESKPNAFDDDTDTESDSGTDDGSEKGVTPTTTNKKTNTKNSNVNTLFERQVRSGPIGEAMATGKQIAWVEINIGSGSYVRYKMPYFAKDLDGCVSDLFCEIKDFKLSNGGATSLKGNKTNLFRNADI